MLGNLTWGHFSETRLGRRGAATIATLGGIAVIPLYVFASQSAMLLVGGFVMGLFGVGNFGVVPSYLNERFPTAARAAGAGLAYHTGAAASSLMPFIVGAMQDRGVALANAMAYCIAITGALVLFFIWIGPETRGRVTDGRRNASRSAASRRELRNSPSSIRNPDRITPVSNSEF